jgi:L-methionine (R)-S-oxide reductase
MRPTTLGRLHDLARFLTAEEHLNARLPALANHAARATQAAACSIMLASEEEGADARLKLWAASEILPTEAWTDSPGVGQSIAGRVLIEASPLLIDDIEMSDFRSLARRRPDLGPSCMCVPIVVGEKVIGVMNFSNRPDCSPFLAADLLVAEIAAAMVGKSVQVERLQTLLRSRVAHMALAQGERAVASQMIGQSPHPARVAKLLAKSFYKDLSAAGFEPGQIIDAASEIIEHVTHDVTRYRKRFERSGQGE